MAALEEYNNQHEFARDDKSEYVFVKNEPISGDEHEDSNGSEEENESSEAEIDCNNHPQLKRLKSEVNEFTYEEKSDLGYVVVKNEPMSRHKQDDGGTSEDENESSEAEIDCNNHTQLKRLKSEVNEFTYEEKPDLGYVSVKNEPISGDEQDGGRTNEDKNENIHTEFNRFQCEFNNKEFSKNSNLKPHLRLHSRDIKLNEQNGDLSENERETDSNNLLKIKLYKCEFCNKEFSNNYDVTQHLKLHSGEFTSNKQNGDGNGDEKGVAGSNKKVKRFRCKFCDKVFSRNNNLKRHLKLHSGEINYHDSSSSGSDNESVVSGSKIKRFQCEFCDKTFSRNSNLKRHLKLHSGKINGQNDNSSGDDSDEKKRFRCKFCHKNFSKNSHLKSHLIIHSGVKDFKCTICKREFSRKDSLEKHFKTHTGDKQYSCRVCNKQFIQKGNLRRHERIHSGIKEYKCMICNKEFLEKRNLKKHAEIHFKEFKCTKCNKEFLRQEDFTKHLKFNSGVEECNQFECSICQKQFITNKKLKSHMKIHSVLKEYKCKICNRQFTYKHYLVKHMRTHSYVKDFQCAVCKKQFSHKSSLIRHLEHHKNESKSKKQMAAQDMDVKQEPQDREQTNENFVDVNQIATCEDKANREFVFVKCEAVSSDEQYGGDSASDD